MIKKISESIRRYFSIHVRNLYSEAISLALRPFIPALNLLTCVVLIPALSSCSRNMVPRPYGYNRIDFPRHEYKVFSPGGCNFLMEIPSYSSTESDSGYSCWFNIYFPQYLAKLHLTYKDFRSEDEFHEIASEHRMLVLKHLSKATSLLDSTFLTPGGGSVFFEIEGNVGTPLQFFLTDSSRHVLTGALYFTVVIKNDSLLPVVDFLKQDILHIIHSVRWRD